MDIMDLGKDMQKKIERMLLDSEFREFCRRERTHKDFDEIFKDSKKIAKINISNIKINRSLISNLHAFTPEQIKTDVLGFYKHLDDLDPNGTNLTDIIKENAQYLRTKPKNKDERSFCASGIDRDGNKHKEIFINIEGRINDASNAIHEMCHSCCKTFLESEKRKDWRVDEVPTLITDNLSTDYLKQTHPEFKENFLENEKFTEVFNVKKARECVADALIIKIMCGEVSVTEALNQYGDLYNDFPDILPTKLSQIEEGRYNPLYEYRYLVPRAISTEMAERYRENPELVAKQIKEVIDDNHKLTQEETLKILELPEKDKLLDDYVSKFSSRIQEINDEQNKLGYDNPSS